VRPTKCICGCGRPALASKHAGLPVASWLCFARINAAAKKEAK